MFTIYIDRYGHILRINRKILCNTNVQIIIYQLWKLWKNIIKKSFRNNGRISKSNERNSKISFVFY